MIQKFNDPKSSWRNHKRIRFIKGFYQTRHLLINMINRFEQNEPITHTQIDNLLETNLRELKDLSHFLYRPQKKRQIDKGNQRLFDKILGTLWHELDKARDNIRLCEAYTSHEMFEGDQAYRSLSRLDNQILSSAKKDLPRQLQRAKKLMAELVPLFEKIFPVYKNNEVILRTLYFSRRELDRLCSPSTVKYFFPLLHGSVPVGYYYLIRSLAETKHFDYADRVLHELRNWVKHDPTGQMVFEEAEIELRKIRG